jgi:DNA-binding CsgD family transcriptional regulator
MTVAPSGPGIPGAAEFLVERGPELHRLRHAVGRLAAHRRSAPLVLTGTRGAGLSALLDVAVAEAGAIGIPAAVARCTPAEARLPYGVVTQLAAQLAGAGHRLPLRLLGTPARAAVPGLCAEFLDLARRQPLVLAVDDVHWVDPASRRWLGALAGRAGQAPLLLVQAGAIAQPRPPATVLHVRPLGEQAVREVIGARCGHPADPAFVTRAARATGGSPAVLRDVLDRFARLDLPPTTEHVAAVAAHAASVVGDRAVAALDRLPADALALIRAMAVCGDAGDLDFVRALAPPGRRSADASCALLVRLGLVPPGETPGDMPGERPVLGPELATRVLAGMPAGERADLARRAAELGHRVALPGDRLAALVAQAPPLHTEWAVHALRAAAARRPADEAVALLTRALREDVPALRPEVLVDLARAESARGVGTRRLEEVLLGAGPEVPDRVLVIAADLLQTGGDAQAADRAIAVACARRPDQAALAAIGWLAANDSAVEPALPAPVTTRAEQLGDPVLAAVAGWRLAMRGRKRARAREFAFAALAGAGQDGPFGPRILACRVLRAAGDLAEAVAALDDVVADARRAGARQAAAQALVERARCELSRGGLTRVAGDLAAARTELPTDQWHPRLLPALAGLDAVRALVEDDVTEAERVLATPLPAAAASGTAWAYYRYAQGCLRLALADPVAALPPLLDCGRVLTVRRQTSPALSAWRSMAAIAYAGAGERDAAAAQVRDAVERALIWGDPATHGLTHLLAAYTGDEEVTHLRAAVGLLAASPARVHRALAQQEAAGARHAPGAAFALSIEDRRVAQLAAAGRSNADIARLLSLGIRTVEARLTGIYRALGLSGRRALAAVFRPPVVLG